MRIKVFLDVILYGQVFVSQCFTGYTIFIFKGKQSSRPEYS